AGPACRRSIIRTLTPGVQRARAFGVRNPERRWYIECVADREAIERGMTTQLRAFRDAIAQGQPRLGWKIGINDPKMLERLELATPVVGWLAGARALKSGDTYVLRAGTRVGLEAEVA